MSNVINLRPDIGFVPGDFVHIGTGKEVYEVQSLGASTPVEGKFIKGEFINAHEFVMLKVPGSDRYCFEIHYRNIKKVSRETMAVLEEEI